MSESSPSSSYFNIEKLTSDNFTAWRYRIKMVLTVKELYSYIDGSNPTPTIPAAPPADVEAGKVAYRIWKKQDDLAKGYIGLSVSNDEIIHIESANTAKEAWDNIVAVYTAKGLSSKLYFRKKLLGIKKSETESMQKHINNIKEVVSKLAAIGEEIKDLDLAIILMSSLPKEYDTFIETLEGKATNELTSVYVINRLLGYAEKTEHANDDRLSEAKVSAFYSESHQGNNNNNNNNYSDSNYNHSHNTSTSSAKRRGYADIICHFCKKPGHIARMCYAKNGYP